MIIIVVIKCKGNTADLDLMVDPTAEKTSETRSGPQSNSNRNDTDNTFVNDRQANIAHRDQVRETRSQLKRELRDTALAYKALQVEANVAWTKWQKNVTKTQHRIKALSLDLERKVKQCRQGDNDQTHEPFHPYPYRAVCCFHDRRRGEFMRASAFTQHRQHAKFQGKTNQLSRGAAVIQGRHRVQYTAWTIEQTHLRLELYMPWSSQEVESTSMNDCTREYRLQHSCM